jgi:hypothetical protein
VTSTEDVIQISSDNHSISDKRQQKKYTKINRTVTNLDQDFVTDGQVLEGVQKFKYLGSLINSKNVKSEEIKLRIAASDRCFIV